MITAVRGEALDGDDRYPVLLAYLACVDAELLATSVVIASAPGRSGRRPVRQRPLGAGHRVGDAGVVAGLRGRLSTTCRRRPSTG